MAKLKRGRLDGVWGMTTFTAEDIHALADKYEWQLLDPKNPDDPRYLIRRAKKLRKLAEQKERAQEHKTRSKREDRK